MTRAAQDRFRRSDLLKRSLVVGGAALGGAVLSGAPRATDAAQNPDADIRALNLLLKVEYAEAALYAEAIKSGALDGELLEFARQVAEQEQAHLDFLRQQLGSRADRRPEYDFKDATEDSDSFVKAATELEDLAVAAYNGQATNVSRAALEAAATIVSVEARHAAWIRSIVGRLPASSATDSPKSADQVLESLSRLEG